MPVNYGHHGSANMAALLHPTCGIRDELRRKGVTPRDHARDNIKLIREMQRKNAEKKAAAAEAEATSPRASPRFNKVSSRVTRDLERPSTAELPLRPSPPKPFMAGKPAADRTGILTAWEVPPLLDYDGISSDAAAILAKAKRREPVPNGMHGMRPSSASSEPRTDFVSRNVSLASKTPRRHQRATVSPETANKHTHRESRRFELALQGSCVGCSHSLAARPIPHHMH